MRQSYTLLTSLGGGLRTGKGLPERLHPLHGLPESLHPCTSGLFSIVQGVDARYFEKDGFPYADCCLPQVVSLAVSCIYAKKRNCLFSFPPLCHSVPKIDDLKNAVVSRRRGVEEACVGTGGECPLTCFCAILQDYYPCIHGERRCCLCRTHSRRRKKVSVLARRHGAAL